MRLQDINIRDPFVLLDDGTYYLYGTRAATCWGEADGFDVYESDDLIEWSAPHACFTNDFGFYATENYWAPEVYKINGAYYMAASFKAPNVSRGTCILRADSPLGLFRPHSDGPVTPRDWECLDGTLYRSPQGGYYLIFCHEWTQIGDGEVRATRLTDDLRAPLGEPRLLFKASDAPWTKKIHHKRSGRDGYVTDGPFAYRARDGRLLLLWSSLSQNGYALAVAQSDDGDITGRFDVSAPPLFDRDGGHGMVFKDKDGRLLLTLHRPNDTPNERPLFLPVKDENGLRL